MQRGFQRGVSVWTVERDAAPLTHGPCEHIHADTMRRSALLSSSAISRGSVELRDDSRT
jgi:hypothetical protein